MSYRITLNKRNKRIQVKRLNKNIRLGITKHRINLKHSGLRGPTGVSTFVRVHHGTNPNVLRPNALYVEWVGTVAPVNGTTEDTWIDTA